LKTDITTETNNKTDGTAARLKAYFDEHFDEILSDLSEIMSIDSTYSEPCEGKPFGKGSAAALEWGMKKCEKLGLDVKNFDNYAISATYGENPVLGILSHLDVVPVGDGWTYPPFACTVDGGNIYGRGAIDDKAPSVAVLWAAKALFELEIPLKKGFRIIFGGNEEGGCEDIEYYEKQEAFPPMVFTPDGSFPVLNCEKGMIHLTFSAKFEDLQISHICGGTVINAIPDSCTAIISGETHEFHGKSSHGSRPENGENAVTKFLSDYCKNGKNQLLAALNRLFPHGEFDGVSCGMGFSDEISGKMTCALTMLSLNGGRLCGGIDIRYPIDRTLAEITEIITDKLTAAGFEIDECSGMEPHYVSADTPLVRTLLDVYEEVKGEKGEPIAEGGITYVHNTAGGVAFGAEFPWENNNMHGDDEHISIETFKLNLNMYANAIARLCE
jgi:succinyl-diaminopimelate desuccinylase